jgi:hypothetical protein
MLRSGCNGTWGNAARRSRKPRNGNLPRYNFPVLFQLNLRPVHQGEHRLGVACQDGGSISETRSPPVSLK